MPNQVNGWLITIGNSFFPFLVIPAGSRNPVAMEGTLMPPKACHPWPLDSGVQAGMTGAINVRDLLE
ncbi:MAG TPA: hypothetical protein VFK96_01295 [Gammaproteobacteria bacterium]|nr:hypothetical protein [Gammaproteobacteria bacterium]